MRRIIAFALCLLAFPAAAQSPGTVNLVGPSTSPGSPQVTPQAVNDAVNAALTAKADTVGLTNEIARAMSAEAGLLPKGPINNTPIGSTTPSTGAFTTLSGSYTTPNGATSYSLAARSAFTTNVLDGVAALAVPTVPIVATGAKGDCSTDDWWSFQAAIFLAAAQPGGGTVVIPPPPGGVCYRISQALRLQSNVHVVVQSPSTRIHCTGDATGTDQTGATGLNVFPLYACSFYGAGNTVNLVRLPTYASSAISKGLTSVTLTTPSDSANFVVGDLIMVRTPTANDYTEGGLSMPHWGMMVKITAINAGTGLVTFDRPITPDATYATSLVLKLTNGAGAPGWITINNANGVDTHIPFWATINAGIEGGIWDGGSTFPFQDGGSALDCIETPDQVFGLLGAGYSNMFQSCRISVRREIVSREAWELSYLSSYNQIEIGTIQAQNAILNQEAPGWLMGITEGSNGNSVHVGNIASYVGDSVPYLVLSGTPTGGGGDIVTANIILSSNPGVNVASSYTTVGGDTLITAATGLANAINANATISGAGITAFTRSSVYPGAVLLNRSGTTMFNAKGANTGAIAVAGFLTDMLNINIAYNNSVTLDNIDGDAVTGNIIHIQQGVSGTPPPSSNNAVQLGVVPLLFADRYVKMENSGSSGNIVQAAPGGGQFLGGVFTAGAFQYAANAGAGNTMSGLTGAGTIAALSCLVTDPTTQLGNRFTNMHAPATEADNLVSLQVLNVSICPRRGGSDAAIRQLRGYVSGIWAPGNATSSAGQARTYTYPANSLEIYNVISTHLTVRLTGSAGVKTGHFALQGCNAGFSIPADATYADIWYKAEISGASATNCWTTTTTDSAVTPGSVMTAPAQSTSSISLSGNYNWTLDVTTSTDQVVTKSLQSWADSPLFDSNVPW